MVPVVNMYLASFMYNQREMRNTDCEKNVDFSKGAH